MFSVIWGMKQSFMVWNFQHSKKQFPEFGAIQIFRLVILNLYLFPVKFSYLLLQGWSFSCQNTRKNALCKTIQDLPDMGPESPCHFCIHPKLTCPLLKAGNDSLSSISSTESNSKFAGLFREPVSKPAGRKALKSSWKRTKEMYVFGVMQCGPVPAAYM